MSIKLFLIAANETVIKTYGEQSLTLDLGLRIPLTWVFIIIQVKQPIVGADFLRNDDLLVYMNKRKLVDMNTCLQVNSTLTTDCEIYGVRIIKQVNKIFTVLSKHERITRVDYQKECTLHHLQHHISTTSPPI